MTMPDTQRPSGRPPGSAESDHDYWCFISYSHEDNRVPGRQWATWLHQQIETYEVPPSLVGTVNDRGERVPQRIFPAFRDEEELAAGAALAAQIYEALDRSRVLVVLCSPRAAQSSYVADEIRYFKRSRSSERVLAALLEGKPTTVQAPTTAGESPDPQASLPVPLAHEIDAQGRLLPAEFEPLAADFRLIGTSAQGWTSPEAYRQSLLRHGDLPIEELERSVAEYARHCELAKLKIVAGILGLPLRSLTERDKAYQLELERKRTRRLVRVAAVIGALLIVSVIAGLWAWNERQHAETRRIEAERQRELALARSLASNAQLLAIEQPARLSTRILLATEALRRSPSIGAYMTLHAAIALLPARGPILRHGAPVRGYVFSPDGSVLASAARHEPVRLWRVRDGATRATVNEVIDSTRLVFSPDGRLLASDGRGTAQIIAVDEGRVVRTLPASDGVSDLRFSADGMHVMTRGREGREITVWEVSSGRSVLRTSVDSGKDDSRSDEPRIAGAFSNANSFVTVDALGKIRAWQLGDGRNTWTRSVVSDELVGLPFARLSHVIGDTRCEGGGRGLELGRHDRRLSRRPGPGRVREPRGRIPRTGRTRHAQDPRSPKGGGGRSAVGGGSVRGHLEHGRSPCMGAGKRSTRRTSRGSGSSVQHRPCGRPAQRA